MAWDDELTLEQKMAASYSGTHACLIGGPGTGKTRVLIRRILYLIEARGIDPSMITALTFTRAAAAELRRRVTERLNTGLRPRIATLHSFALRQMLRNSDLAPDIPRPVRIADDWEERNIIEEDLKTMLNSSIDDIRDRFISLSSDWHDLSADDQGWRESYPDGAFLGAWRKHRTIHGYAVRAELVFRLKRALELHDDFSIEGAPGFLLVDEYQDLNLCDQKVIKALGARDAEVYGAGDDDQSIYGFRRASPQGIRDFLRDYPGATRLYLTEGKRCDPRILALGEFVAQQDYERLKKKLKADHAQPEGEVHILRFPHQYSEARGVVDLCKYLLNVKAYEPQDILVLMRTDYRGKYSSVLVSALESEGLPVWTGAIQKSPIDKPAGRQMLALLRLAIDETDSLAWRTLLQLRRVGIGPKCVKAIFEQADIRGLTFARALREIRLEPSLVKSLGARIARGAKAVTVLIEAARDVLPSPEQVQLLEVDERQALLLAVLPQIAELLGLSHQDATVVVDYLGPLVSATDSTSVEELLLATAVSSEKIEQELANDKINVMTMHKAKGLTANAVIIVAAEDELTPGNNETGALFKDELRLLYVSLTRARHHLYVTYCTNRLRDQMRSGRPPYRPGRHLTRFLTEGPIHAEEGWRYIRSLRGK